MRVRGWAWLAPGALALVFACMGCRTQTLTDPSDPGPQGIQDAGSRDDGPGVSPPACTSACCNFVAPNCPPAPPAAGTPCGTPSSSACEYGDDQNIACDTLVRCTSTGWSVEQLFSGQNATCPTPASLCPATFASAIADGGVECPDSELYIPCVYPEGVCTCAEWWSCSPGPNDCPATRPRAGTPCDVDGGGCQTWGMSCGRDAMFCSCGVWVPVFCISEG